MNISPQEPTKIIIPSNLLKYQQEMNFDSENEDEDDLPILEHSLFSNNLILQMHDQASE